MVWDRDAFVACVWRAFKEAHPDAWFGESPARVFFGRDLGHLVLGLPPRWRGLFLAHMRIRPDAFRRAGARAEGGLVAVFRPEALLLLPLRVETAPPPAGPVPDAPETAFPLAPVRAYPPVRVAPGCARVELPVQRIWWDALHAARRYSTCAAPSAPEIYAAVWETESEPVARLDRLFHLLRAERDEQLARDPGSGYPRLIACLVRGLGRYRRRLLGLDPDRGPYLLAPMRSGLLAVAAGGGAVPLLFAGEADLRQLVLRAVPPDWGRPLDLLLLDASGRPLAPAESWLERVARRYRVERARLGGWLEEAARGVRRAGRPGALVVAERVSGLVLAPVLVRGR